MIVFIIVSATVFIFMIINATPYTKSKAVGLSQTDLLQDNHRSVFETVTCMLLICCMPVTELPQVCHMPVIYLF